MKHPIHVLFFTGSLGTGGSETHLTHLVTGLDRRRVQPELLLLRASANTHRIEQVRDSQVPVHDLAGSLKGIRDSFRRIRPDIIHTYGYPCDIYAPLLARRRSGARVVTTRRGNQPFRRRVMLYRATNPLVGRILCVSSSAQEYAIRTERLDRAKCAVIPNGVDLGSIPARTVARRPLQVIGTHGRLGWIKGTDLLLEAFALLGRPGLSLKIAGPTADPWSRRLVAAHQGAEGVSFVGDVTDVQAFLGALDVFVLPSRSEGMSMALLEAMAAGLPVLATDVDSNREVLADGAAGVVVPPDPRSIADALRWLLDHPQEASRLGAAARRHIEAEYRMDTMLRRYETFYESMSVATT